MAIDRRRVLGGLAVATVRLGPAAAAPPPGPVTLEAGAAALKLAGAADTAVWAYNGRVPGPLLRVKLGDEVAVRLVNKLAQPTTLRWHGLRLPNAMAGIGGLTQAPVMPGQEFSYRFTPPDAGLYWYYPHVWPNTAEQVGRGLYGALIVDEAQPPAVDEDVLVVLDDWALDAAGQLKGFDAAKDGQGEGRLGALLTVAGAPAPARRRMRPGSRVRLRLLNACAARIAVVALDGAKATVIAIDGQPSELFEPGRGMLPIGPGSRFEVIADLPADLSVARAATLVLRGDGMPDQPLVVLEAAGEAVPPRGAVAKLPENPLLPTRIPLERSLKRDLVIAAAGTPGAPFAWTLDGQGSDGASGKPLFTVKRGAAVTLAFLNKTADAQQMHVGGHAFRVLHDLDDGWDPYWRDSVLLGPGRTKHVAFIADNPGRWPVESLNAARQVSGLAGHFQVDPAR